MYGCFMCALLISPPYCTPAACLPAVAAPAAQHGARITLASFLPSTVPAFHHLTVHLLLLLPSLQSSMAPASCSPLANYPHTPSPTIAAAAAAPAAQHGARITLASFLPSRGTSLLLSGDARGRLCLHSFSSLLLRTNVSSKVLANGQYGPLLGISHLAPFTMPAPGASGPAAAAAVGGGRGSSWSAGVQGLMGGTPPLSPKGLGPAAGGEEAVWRSLFEVRGCCACSNMFGVRVVLVVMPGPDMAVIGTALVGQLFAELPVHWLKYELT
jgi:hypothetical protein